MESGESRVCFAGGTLALKARHWIVQQSDIDILNPKFELGEPNTAHEYFDELSGYIS